MTDAEEPCPACGAIDYDEYAPFEQWRGGRGGPNGTTVPNPVVSCRVCGHEVPEGTFYAAGSEPDESEDEATQAARIARARAEQRKHQWLSGLLTLRATQFPIYAADGWPGRLGGSGSQRDELTEITIDHYESADAAPLAGDRPRIAVTTKHDGLYPEATLREARWMLESWIGDCSGAVRWPEASHAAITLWLAARDRERRAEVLSAVRSEQPIMIDCTATNALMLNTPRDRWVAVARHADLTITVAAHDLEPAALWLEPIADPTATLLGPEPPDA